MKLSTFTAGACIFGLVALTSACSTVPGAAPAATQSGLPQGSEPVSLDPDSFTTTIDNPYWPMTPGTRWTYRETDSAGIELMVEVIVTSETKTIANGIVARVVRDTVSRDGAIIEDTFDWYAQDTAGAIWYLGEDTAEFENGVVVSRDGSFEAGKDGALPGIVIPAAPAVGMAYRQEYYAGQAEDNGEILAVGAMADTPLGHFTDVLLTWDTITIQPKIAQLKFYAPGVGPVLVLDASGGYGGREELIRVDTVPAGTGTGPLGARG